MRVPVFLNCRDRLTPLTQMVDWLERAGCEEIYLLDNDSAYEPLLEWYERTPHTVIHLGRNFGKHALWGTDEALEKARGRSFVYSDPDIVPDPGCPLDALDRFADLLQRFPGVNKAGFGLRIDDLPDHYRHKQAVLDWEGQFWQWPVGDGAYYASIDTTFALYRPGAGARPPDGIRTGPPYVARHTSWYLDHDDLDEEERFYVSRPGTRGNWSKDELPEWLTDEVRRVRSSRRSRLRLALRRLRAASEVRRRLRGG